MLNVAKILVTAPEDDGFAMRLRECHSALNRAYSQVKLLHAQRSEMLGLAGELALIERCVAAENRYNREKRRWRKLLTRKA